MIIREKDAEELRWQARSDARSLAEAETIKADKERYTRALQASKEIANERIEEVKGLLKVAGKEIPKSKNTDNKVETMFKSRGYDNPATLGKL